ncbi:MAG: ROK family transcriptional regulator, partial [Bifidobacterium sp.]|nr:ROK family transcriptional regulator [Bifidobacterium sp.]
MAISPIPHWFEGSEYTHKVAACIMKYGPISRITLAQILGLSQGAVSRITSDLIYAGVIEETPMAAGHGGKLPKDFLRKSAQKSIQKENTERRGRPQTGLRIIANARTFVGMKINTTHITAVTVNALGQIVTGCHDLPLDDDSPESVVDVIRQLTMDCADEAIMAGLPSPCAVGVSLGGHITDDSVTTFAPFLHWSKPVEFSAMIRKATGLPTGIYNDIDSLVVD